MFGSEKRVLAKHYLDQGLSQTAVAKLLGISRRTSRRWILRGGLDEPGAERRVSYATDGFCPALSARTTTASSASPCSANSTSISPGSTPRDCDASQQFVVGGEIAKSLTSVDRHRDRVFDQCVVPFDERTAVHADIGDGEPCFSGTVAEPSEGK